MLFFYGIMWNEYNYGELLTVEVHTCIWLKKARIFHELFY